MYDDVLLRAHMVQHLFLIMAAPPLLVYGRPVTLLLHATRNPWHQRVIRAVRSRAAAALTWPPFTVALYSAVVLVTHLTPLILATGWLHDGEHLFYLVAGYLFFLPVVGSEPARWRPSLFSRYLLLLAAMPADITVGAAYMLARPFGGYAARDVHAAGVIMLAGTELTMTALALLLAAAMLRPSRGSSQEDSVLDGYNANLSALGVKPSERAAGSVPSDQGPADGKRADGRPTVMPLAADRVRVARRSARPRPPDPRSSAGSAAASRGSGGCSRSPHESAGWDCPPNDLEPSRAYADSAEDRRLTAAQVRAQPTP